MSASKPSNEIETGSLIKVLLAINRYQRGIRIIVIERIFATPNSHFFWSKIRWRHSLLDHSFYLNSWLMQTTLLRQDRGAHRPPQSTQLSRHQEQFLVDRSRITWRNWSLLKSEKAFAVCLAQNFFEILIKRTLNSNLNHNINIMNWCWAPRSKWMSKKFCGPAELILKR